MSVPTSHQGGQVQYTPNGDIQAEIQKWQHLSLEEHKLRLYCEMKSNEDHGRGQNARAHQWSTQAKQHAHKSDEFYRICVQLVLQQNNANAPNAAAINPGASMQIPPNLNGGGQQTAPMQPTYPQHPNQHHVDGSQQQMHGYHPHPLDGPQSIHLGVHQPQVNQQQSQPGYQQSQYAFQQTQASYQQPPQQYPQSGGPCQQQNYSSQQQDQNLPSILFRLAKSCCTIM